MAGRAALRHAFAHTRRDKILFGSARHLCSSVNIIRSPFPDVEIPDCNITEKVFERNASYGKNIAFECCVTGRRYTYEELRIKSRNLNRALRKKLKLQKGDVVAILLPNVPEFPIAVFGTLMAGLTVTTLNPIYTASEIKKQFVDSGSKVLITMTDLYPTAKLALEGITAPVITINDQPSSTTPPGAINFKEFTDNEFDIEDVHIDNNAVAVMPYSSGTTGLPKGVLLTHKNIVSNMSQLKCPQINMVRAAEGSFREVVPCILPMFHIYGMTTSMMMACEGAKAVTLPRFTPELYLNILKEHKPTILFVVPPIVIMLYAHPAVKKEYLESVRTLISGAAPLGALDEQKIKEKAAHISVLQGYGLSECSPTVCTVPYSIGPLPGSAGCVIPNTTVKVMPVGDPNGQPLGPNQLGELYVKGPQVMLGYHNRPKETAETLVDGWLRTGDMFYYDDNQTFYITDRIKELIKVKGFQVPPAELEELIRDHPNVSDAAVIGIPHETHGEVPRAYVVAKADTKLDVGELNAFIDSKVAEYKRLRGGIVVTNSIPKNPSGKILRRELKLKYEKGEK